MAGPRSPLPGGPLASVASERPDDVVAQPQAGETSRWVVLVIACLAQFMVVLDARATCSAAASCSSGGSRSSRSPRCLNGLATSDTWLVAARALQELGGALVSPAALSIITTTFAEGQDRTKALGVWSAIAAGGGAFGLLLGGVLTDLLSWEWIFFVNVPIGIATAALAIR